LVLYKFYENSFREKFRVHLQVYLSGQSVSDEIHGDEYNFFLKFCIKNNRQSVVKMQGERDKLKTSYNDGASACFI